MQGNGKKFGGGAVKIFFSPRHPKIPFPLHPTKIVCHPIRKNFLPPHLPKFFATPPEKIICHPSQKFCHPKTKTNLPSTQNLFLPAHPQNVFATPLPKFFVCPPAATPITTAYPWFSFNIYVYTHDFSTLQYVCVEKCQKIHLNRLKHLCITSFKLLR